MSRRRRPAALAALALGTLGFPGTLAAALPVQGPFGAGAEQVWVIAPSTPPRSVVVFAHGWKPLPTLSAGAWVRQFAPWLTHLTAHGSAVVFPRYQAGGDAVADVRQVRAFRTGLATGLARLGNPRVPVVAVGYSYGGSLVFNYVANAKGWGLPAPAAVMGVFPAGMIPGAPLPPLSRPVRALLLVGDRDTVAGQGGAREFWDWLAPDPSGLRRYAVVRSTPDLSATHAAPKQSTPAAQRAFWQPLDALVDAARGH